MQRGVKVEASFRQTGTRIAPALRVALRGLDREVQGDTRVLDWDSQCPRVVDTDSPDSVRADIRAYVG